MLFGPNLRSPQGGERFCNFPWLKHTLFVCVLEVGLCMPATAAERSRGIIIYKPNGFEPDSSTELIEYVSYQRFAAVFNVRSVTGETIRITPGQDPMFVPSPNDPEANPEGASTSLKSAAMRFPQFRQKLALIEKAWADRARSVAASTAKTPTAQIPLGPPRGASLRTKSGQVFHDWSLSSVESAEGVIIHSDGISRIPLLDFPSEVIAQEPRIAAAIEEQKRAAMRKQTASPTPIPSPSVTASVVPPSSSVSPMPMPSQEPAATPKGDSYEQGKRELLEHTANADEVRERLKVESKGKLVVKGLFLGMHLNDCYAALQSHLGEDTFLLRATARVDKSKVPVLKILRKGGSRVGEIRADPETETVQEFVFWPRLSDYLFNSADLGADEFAQKFIDNYKVPKLKPSRREKQNVWLYEDPEGWELVITPDKTVAVSSSKERKFGD